jgi:hypothetical protein
MGATLDVRLIQPEAVDHRTHPGTEPVRPVRQDPAPGTVAADHPATISAARAATRTGPSTTAGSPPETPSTTTGGKASYPLAGTPTSPPPADCPTSPPAWTAYATPPPDTYPTFTSPAPRPSNIPPHGHNPGATPRWTEEPTSPPRSIANFSTKRWRAWSTRPNGSYFHTALSTNIRTSTSVRSGWSRSTNADHVRLWTIHLFWGKRRQPPPLRPPLRPRSNAIRASPRSDPTVDCPRGPQARACVPHQGQRHRRILPNQPEYRRAMPDSPTGEPLVAFPLAPSRSPHLWAGG